MEKINQNKCASNMLSLISGRFGDLTERFGLRQYTEFTRF